MILCAPVYAGTASVQQHEDIVRLLVSYGVQLEAENNLNETALHVAARQGNITALVALTQQVHTARQPHFHYCSHHPNLVSFVHVK